MKKPTTLPPNFVPTKALLNIECPLGEQGRHWMLLASALRNVWNLLIFFCGLKNVFSKIICMFPITKTYKFVVGFLLPSHPCHATLSTISGRPLCQERSKSLSLTPVAHETCPEPEGRNPKTHAHLTDNPLNVAKLGHSKKKNTPEFLNPTQSQICPGPICETTPSLSETCETL